MDSVGEGEGGKMWENGIETCKISCMKRDASPGSMHDTGCLVLVHWDDPEGWYGEGGQILLLLLLSHFSHVRLFATPWAAAYQAPPSMGFSRQEYWSGVPLPSPML